ncbi:MAG TPA: winged helix-turn-helix domain-containing protein [Ktedonosporobacter sp.]|jgi:DNA-binding transcriptional ArsR family regulator|nr:winged helix-turn-helix domain-containing protein [Ktedonosporobacter sp.]
MATPPESASDAVLPEEAPVVMPELPMRLQVNTVQQFKAMGDPLRWRILNLIQHQPYTAKQIAERLKASPGTIGHHLQVLEASGLAQVVARRMVHGIVAKYYTRTARIFMLDFPSEVTGNTPTSLKIMTDARTEMAEAMETEGEDAVLTSGLPHMRLSPERAKIYMERLQALVDDFLQETPAPDGQMYSLYTALFKAPSYLQTNDQKKL